MPLFHFNLSDGACEPDDDGTDLPDVQAAKIEAVRHAAELMKDDPREIWADGALKVDVTDHGGRRLFSVTVIVADAGR